MGARRFARGAEKDIEYLANLMGRSLYPPGRKPNYDLSLPEGKEENALTTTLPGGTAYTQYRELPWWQQLIYETPGYIATGGITATGIRAGLAGKAGLLPKVTRGVLKPAELAETGLAKTIEAPIKGARAIAGKIPILTKSLGQLTEREGLLPSAEQVVSTIKTPSKLARPPVIKQMARVIDPTLVERNPVIAAKAAQGSFRDMSEGYVALDLAKLDTAIAKGAKPALLKDGIVSPKTGIKALETAPKLPDGSFSMNVHDIAEWFERYDVPAKYRPYFEELRNAARTASLRLERELANYDISLRKIAGESDWVYIRRVVDKIGDIERIGLPNWREMQQARVYEVAGAGTKAPKAVTYLDPEKELKYQLQSAYEWITNLRTKEILTPLTTTAKARVAPEIIDDLIAKNSRRIVADKIYGTSSFPSLLTRVKRGETLSPQTLAMIRREFPEMADDIAKVMSMPMGRERVIAATGLRKAFLSIQTTARQEYWEAQKLYQMRLAQAGKKMDEGTSWFLPGRIFTTQELAGRKVLGRDIAYQVEKQFGYRPPGAFEKVISVAGKGGAILRNLKANLDLSVQGIQTLPALGIDVVNLLSLKPSAYWARGAVKGWQSAFKPVKAMEFLDRAEVRAIWEEFIPRGALLNRSEYAEAVDMLGRIPVAGKFYQRSGAAFTMGRQATQTYLLMGERDRALRGLVIGSEAFGKRLTELAQWSNIATGVMSTRAMGVSASQRAAENVLMFAPRYTRATLSLILDFAKGGYTGAQARRAIGGLLAAAYAWGTFSALSAGQKPRLNPLPESMGGDGAKWLTVKVGAAYIGIGSTTYQMIRLFGQNWEALMNHPEDLFKLSMDNPNIRYARGKLGAVPALIADFATGHDYLGELTRSNLGDIAKTFGDWGIPIWVEGMLNAQEAGSAPWQVALTGGAELFGGRTLPETDWDKVRTLRELYAEQDFNKAYKSLTQGDIDKLLEAHPDLAELMEKVKARNLEIASNPEKWFIEERQRILDERNNALEKNALAFSRGRMTMEQYLSERDWIRPFYAGSSAVLWSAKEHLSPDVVKDIERYYEKNAQPQDKALDAYQEYRAQLIENADAPRDWDAITASLDKFIKQYDKDTQEYIALHQNDWINDLPPTAKAVESLIVECEGGLDAYYNAAPVAGTQALTTRLSRARLAFRQTNPLIDARLFILGRVSKVQSDTALQEIMRLYNKYGVSSGGASPVAPSTSPAPFTPEEIARKKLREAAGLE
jgi:hypothetical protein